MDYWISVSSDGELFHARLFAKTDLGRFQQEAIAHAEDDAIAECLLCCPNDVVVKVYSLGGT